MRSRIAVFVIVALSTLCLQSPAAALRCANADLSKLAKIVYVSPAGNDGNACGQTTSSPCKTIQQGITNCSGDACGVLVRYGLYNPSNPVTVADGVNLYGSCIFDETDYQYRSTVVGNPAIQAKSIKKPTVIQGFVILGSSALHTAEASIALMVSDSNGLILRQDVLTSGKGGNGGNGSTPSAGSGGPGRGASGDVTGGAGGNACSFTPPPGSIGRGGKGADWQQLHSSWGIAPKATCTNNNYPASLAEGGQASGAISGGAGGGRGSAGCACSGGGGDAGSGGNGDPGKTGPSGTQGGSANPDTKGGFAGTIWRPNAGATGAPGQVGSGGGGGGSGGYGTLRSVRDYMGFPGGGGGGGGCGGPGGTGAQQGGISVALILFQSSVSGLTDANVIIPGPGGAGGKGGTGARGGTGGTGAGGYSGQQYYVEQGLGGIVCKGTVPGRGGRGGNGGQGGAGSGGAGGNGGPSLGIALVNSPALSPNGLTIYSAQPGNGGELGPGGQNDAQNRGADGKPGLAGFSDAIVSYTSGALLSGNP